MRRRACVCSPCRSPIPLRPRGSCRLLGGDPYKRVVLIQMKALCKCHFKPQWITVHERADLAVI